MPITCHLPEEIHRALRARAARHGRSVEAEVHDILVSALGTPQRMRLGTLLFEIGRKARLSDDEFAVFERAARR